MPFMYIFFKKADRKTNFDMILCLNKEYDDDDDDDHSGLALKTVKPPVWAPMWR